jgi:hypothetical protein
MRLGRMARNLERPLDRAGQPVALLARDELLGAKLEALVALGVDASGDLLIESTAVQPRAEPEPVGDAAFPVLVAEAVEVGGVWGRFPAALLAS